MASDNDVLDVITAWSGQRPGKLSQVLEEWWEETAKGSTHGSLAFDPDGIQDLVQRLQIAFPDSPTIETGDLGSCGLIKTVQDLVTALNEPVTKTLRKPAKKAAAKKAVTKKAAVHKAPGSAAGKVSARAARKAPGKAAKKATGKAATKKKSGRAKKRAKGTKR